MPNRPLKVRFGLEIIVSVEPQPAGTGGALWHARDQLEDRFFLLNGDSWFDINLLALACQVPEDASAAGVIALRRVRQYGAVRGHRAGRQPYHRFRRATGAAGVRADQRRSLSIEAERVVGKPRIGLFART